MGLRGEDRGFGERGMMDEINLLEALLHGNQLKQTPRSGWQKRGVPDVESVAAHSYGVAFTALVLSEVVHDVLDRGRLLAMAILHDLPESVTGDITSPAWRLMPADTKAVVESKVMKALLDQTNYRAGWLALWEELQLNETDEARLVHDADKLDLFLQALIYEEQTGNQHLQEFWDIPAEFYFPQSQAIYDLIRKRREGTTKSI
jgi:putative hydrolase of HD superfamily